MANLRDSETIFTVGYNGTLSGTKHGNLQGYQKRYRKIHCFAFSDTYVTSGLHTFLFRNIQAIPKVFEMMSEGGALILKGETAKTRFSKRMANTCGKGFLQTTKLDKN